MHVRRPGSLSKPRDLVARPGYGTDVYLCVQIVISVLTDVFFLLLLLSISYACTFWSLSISVLRVTVTGWSGLAPAELFFKFEKPEHILVVDGGGLGQIRLLAHGTFFPLAMLQLTPSRLHLLSVAGLM